LIQSIVMFLWIDLGSIVPRTRDESAVALAKPSPE
jgi:hypothetical protein